MVGTMAKIDNSVKKKVPELRFKGFTDEWEERKFADFIDVKSGKDYKHLNSGPIPVYGTGGYMLSVDRALSDIDAIGIGRKGTIDKPYLLKAPFWTVDTLFYAVPKQNIDLQFSLSIFKKINWKKFDESTGVPSLSKTVINSVGASIPSYEEQQKIGSFFKQLDDTIALHQRKLDLLKEQKKGFLQKMFPKNGAKVPELRFAGFADDWEQRKLGDISKVIDPHPSHRAPAATEKGIPFIGISDVDEVGNINHKTARIVDEKIFDEHHNRYDLSIPSIGIGRVASLGKVIRLRNDLGKYAVSPTMSVIQFTDNNDLNFLYSNMNTPIFQKQFKSFSNGSTRQSVGIQDLRTLMVSLPIDIEEQKQIGSFFYELDTLITLHQRKLDLLKEQKKGFLQKMFV